MSRTVWLLSLAWFVGCARIWDVATGRQLLILDADVAYITDIAFQPNGQLITANSDGTVHVWNVPKHLAD